MAKKVWEKSHKKLVKIFYDIVEAFPKAELCKMFGYPCAFLNGNMFIRLRKQLLSKGKSFMVSL